MAFKERGGVDSSIKEQGEHRENTRVSNLNQNSTQQPAYTYVISDIHGYLDAFRRALELVDLENDHAAKLVLLGDYIDRGPDSRGVLELVRNLQQRYPDRVIALLGNHDVWMLEWLDGPDSDTTWLIADAEFRTVRSFISNEFIDAIPMNASGDEINRLVKNEMLAQHGELIKWLRTLPLVHETEDHIFVHAGINELAGVHWREATSNYVLTHKYPPSTGRFLKTIVAGHVRTVELHSDGSHGVFHDGASHWYVDGAVEVTGRLNVLRFDENTRLYEGWSAEPARSAGSGSPS